MQVGVKVDAIALIATSSTQLAALGLHYSIQILWLQHSWRSLPVYCRILSLQPGLLLEGLAVTPTIIQRHVGSLAVVSLCHMWFDIAYALFEQPIP